VESRNESVAMVTKEELEGIFKNYGDGAFDQMYFEFNIAFIEKDLYGKHVLEMSTNIGSTLYLRNLPLETLTVIDGSEDKLDSVRDAIDDEYSDLAGSVLSSSHPVYVCSFFEEYKPERKFDEIIFFRALEHLEDPGAVLRETREWLKPGGHITVSVPNADSLHRRLGVELGLMKVTTELTMADLKKGHLRVYTKESFREDVLSAGYNIDWIKGSFVKTVTDAEMKRNAFYSVNKLRAIYEMSKRLDPELCAELIMRCSL
jgi:SAM-dependent methyltransferase